MKYYFDILSDIIKSFQKDLETGGDKLSDFLDKIVVWIISLSTGSIALIFASTGKFSFVSQDSINLTLLFLLLSIIFGVLGRGLSAISSYIGYKLISQFNFDLKMTEIPFVSRELNGTESAELIYRHIKEDFNTDFPSIIENMKGLNKDELNNYNERIRNFYIEFHAYCVEKKFKF